MERSRLDNIADEVAQVEGIAADGLACQSTNPGARFRSTRSGGARCVD
jgi:hypothetical protein